jgi:hypothetical protein
MGRDITEGLQLPHTLFVVCWISRPYTSFLSEKFYSNALACALQDILFRMPHDVFHHHHHSIKTPHYPSTTDYQCAFLLSPQTDSHR